MTKDALSRLLTAWNEPEAQHRAAILDGALSASGVYYADPHLPEPATDRTAFEDFLDKFTTALPDAELETGPVLVHHGHARVEAKLSRGDQIIAKGHYFADLDEDGRVARLIGFME